MRLPCSNLIYSLTLLFLLLGSWSAAVAAGGSAGYVVGDLSRSDALIFEGLQAVHREEIINALASQHEYQLAAHPAAPVRVYLDTLKHSILAGYQHSGFPLAMVSARVSDDGAHHVIVRVLEGPRFRCGEIKVVGGKRFLNDPLRAQLIQRLTAPCPCEDQGASSFRHHSASPLPGQTNRVDTPWLAGQPAPFDEISRQTFTTCAENAILDMGYFQTKLYVRVEQDPARSLAYLVVEFFHDGVRGTVAEIDVQGCQKNTREQVLNYLHLKKGMEVPPGFLAGLEDNLWNSARFRRHDVSLVPLAKPGQQQLKIELSEIAEAPPLGQEFDPAMQEVLKFSHWLEQFNTQPEDLTATFKARIGAWPWEGTLACSAAGLAVSLRNPDAKPATILDWTAVVAEPRTAFYSGAQQRKLMITNIPAQLEVYAQTERQGDSNNVTFGMGFAGEQSPVPPVRFAFDLEPALFVHLLASNSVYSTADGVATFGNLPAVETNDWKLKLDAGTGRLLGFEFHQPTFELTATSGSGAFARNLEEIDRRAQAYRHAVSGAGGHPAVLPSAISIFGPDLLRWVSLLRTNSSPGGTVLLQWLTDQADFGRIVSPWNRLFAPGPDSSFVIPDAKGGSKPDGLAAGMREFSDFLLQKCDDISPHGSWPWTVLHETAMTCGGQGQYLGAEVQRTLESPDTSPVGCLVALSFQARFDPNAARAYFAHSLATVSPAGFRKDWRLLLDEHTVLGGFLANLLGELRSITDAEAAVLTAGSSPDEAAFLLQCVQLLKANRDQPVSEALWPALEQHWDQVVRPGLLAGYVQVFQRVETALRSQGNAVEANAVHRELLALNQKLSAPKAADAKAANAAAGHAH